MATYRQAINRVLVVMGEPEIESIATELTEDYHKLIGSFVNLIKEEIEGANQWRDLCAAIDITYTGSATFASITGSTRKSSVLQLHDQETGQLIPLVFDRTDTNHVFPLREYSPRRFSYIDNVAHTTSTAPSYFSVDRPNPSTGSTLSLLLYPTPTANRSIRLVMYTPQARLEDDDLDTEILIPELPLELGTMWWALEERGEELGQGNIFTEERYRNALDAAVTRDIEETGGLVLTVV